MANSTRRETQRVSNVKDAIKQAFLSEQQITISEIAESHNVSESYAYKLLDGIAKELGVTRDVLLRYPKTCYTRTSPLLTKPEKADVSKLLKTLNQAIQDIESLMSEIQEVLKEN